tara:strand:+ start:201 stop:848 length:648 start_codon:yes stop_codon:yes gene_type:complete
MLKYFKIIALILLSFLISNDRGWTHPQTGWEIITNQNMAFFLINSAYIDNEELESNQSDVIGVFFGEQNIGWEFYNSQITIIPTSGDNGEMPNYPETGDSISFKIYDASEDIIIPANSIFEIPLWENHGFENIQSIASCNSGFPLLNDGSCIINCLGDPNLDGDISVLDIMEIIFLIINCSNPNICFENELECTDYDSNGITDIIDIILILQNIF